LFGGQLVQCGALVRGAQAHGGPFREPEVVLGMTLSCRGRRRLGSLELLGGEGPKALQEAVAVASTAGGGDQ